MTVIFVGVLSLAAGYFIGCNRANWPKLPDWTITK